MVSGECPGQSVHTPAPYFGFATNLLCDTGVGAISLFLTHPSIHPFKKYLLMSTLGQQAVN